VQFSLRKDNGKWRKTSTVWLFGRGPLSCLCIYKLTRSFPKEEMYGLVSQMRRASVSVASNIAEGRGRLNSAEFRQFLGVAQGSIFELKTQLLVAGKLGMADLGTLDEAESLGEEASKMLGSFIEKLRPATKKLKAENFQRGIMKPPLHIVVCAGIVPDPLQTLDPITTPSGPGLKNEMVLPAVLDPWAASALYEAANLAAKNPGSKLWLVSLGPKAKLQQVMMTVAQKVPFELVPVEGPIGGFPDAHSTAAALASAIQSIPNLETAELLLFGGWESASRGAGVTLQLIGERLNITDQFQGVDQIAQIAGRDDGSFEVLERVEGGKHQVSVCLGAAAVLGWATGNLPEPRNNPQVGMANMRNLMPALQKAKSASIAANSLRYISVNLPRQQRATRVVKDMSPEEIANELVEWIGAE
jgi:electron transfer flavoprotein beta subunit